MGRGDQAADHGDATSLGGDALRGLAIAGHKRRTLHQIAWRVAADRELGKQNQAGAGRSRPAREVDDPGGVAGEISNRGIDLSQRDLHSSSVKGTVRGSQVRPSVVAGDPPA